MRYGKMRIGKSARAQSKNALDVPSLRFRAPSLPTIEESYLRANPGVRGRLARLVQKIPTLKDAPSLQAHKPLLFPPLIQKCLPTHPDFTFISNFTLRLSGGIGRHAGLRILFRKECGFDPRLKHQGRSPWTSDAFASCVALRRPGPGGYCLPLTHCHSAIARNLQSRGDSRNRRSNGAAPGPPMLPHRVSTCAARARAAIAFS